MSQELVETLSDCHYFGAAVSDPGRSELLRSWFSLQPCVSEEIAANLWPFAFLGGLLFSCWQCPGSSISEGLWFPWLLLDFEQQTRHAYSLRGKLPVVIFSNSKWSGGFSSKRVRAGLKHIKWSAIGSREAGLKQTCWELIHWHVSDVWGKFNSLTLVLLRYPCYYSRAHCSQRTVVHSPHSWNL